MRQCMCGQHDPEGYYIDALAGCQSRGAVDADGRIVAPVYTHSIRWMTCFPGLRNQRALRFRSREGLVNGMIVHGEMPGEKSSAIVTASEPLVHCERVIQRVGTTRRIVCRMN